MAEIKSESTDVTSYISSRLWDLHPGTHQKCGISIKVEDTERDSHHLNLNKISMITTKLMPNGIVE